jgi:hypothetical protein
MVYLEERRRDAAIARGLLLQALRQLSIAFYDDDMVPGRHPSHGRLPRTNGLLRWECAALQCAVLPREADEKRGGTGSGSRLSSSTAQLRHCLMPDRGINQRWRIDDFTADASTGVTASMRRVLFCTKLPP